MEIQKEAEEYFQFLTKKYIQNLILRMSVFEQELEIRELSLSQYTEKLYQRIILLQWDLSEKRIQSKEDIRTIITINSI